MAGMGMGMTRDYIYLRIIHNPLIMVLIIIIMASIIIINIMTILIVNYESLR